MRPRTPTLLAGLAALGAVVLPACWRPAPRLIWNATASVPVGLYFVHVLPTPVVGDLVAVRAPEPVGLRLAQGGHLPLGALLLKRVVALRGATVCRVGLTVTVDGAALAEAHERDRAGHPLPAWQGCQLLGERQVFLLNRDEPASLDGRYFGPFPTSSIVGRAVPLWTW